MGILAQSMGRAGIVTIVIVNYLSGCKFVGLIEDTVDVNGYLVLEASKYFICSDIFLVDL